MNIRIGIQVITVISSEALISYQQVYVNNDYAAEADFERQTNIHNPSLTGKIIFHKFSRYFV